MINSIIDIAESLELSNRYCRIFRIFFCRVDDELVSWLGYKKRQLLCWSVWKCRNDMVWKQKGLEVEDIVMSAKVVLNQWHSAQHKSFDHYLGLMTQDDGDDCWIAPKVSKVKVNTDAALFS